MGYRHLWLLISGGCYQLYWLLKVCVLATSKGISRWVPTCDSAHSERIGNAAPLGNYTPGIMSRYPTESHYPDIELPSPCPILLIQSARLGGNKCKFCKSLVSLDWKLNSRHYPWEACALPTGPPRPGYQLYPAFMLGTRLDSRNECFQFSMLCCITNHLPCPRTKLYQSATLTANIQ